MLIIRRVTALSQLTGAIDSRVLVSEDALLRVTRTGFSLSYLPAGSAQWRDYLPGPDALPQQTFADPRAALFAAYDDAKLIGLAGVRTEDNGWGMLVDLRVDAGHRRLGVGTQLLDACRQYAARHAMGGLRACVPDDNPVMCRFLEKLGFQLGGMDRLALALTPSERDKPLLRRACLFTFYDAMNRKG